MNTIKKSYIFLIIGALLISFAPVLIKYAGAPGIVTVFYRLLFGTLTLIIPFFISRIKSKTKISRKGMLFATIAGLFLSIDMALWSTGIMKSNAAMPTLVGNLSPLWVGIGAVFIFKERQSIKFWLGLFIAFTGVSFLVIQEFYSVNGIFSGLMYGLFSGMFYAAFMLLAQKGREHLDTLSFLFLSTLSTTIFLGVFALAEGLEFSGYSSNVWTVFIIMGVFIQAGAWYFINYSQGYLPASLVAPTLLAQPVLAGVIAYFILGEELTLWQICGGLVVVVGIYTVHFAKQEIRK